MSVSLASRLSFAAMALFAVLASWHATLVVPGVIV